VARKGLGRGLGALLPDYDEGVDAENIVELKIIDVEPNANQPRKAFDAEKLEKLASSISAHGVITPILVTKNGERYTIIAGERRWRASKMAGLKTIPAIVRSYDEVTLFEVSLIENLQREDLNPIEEAKGYKLLIDSFSLTQEMISKRVGKSRSAVANSLRILTLPADVILMIENEMLTTGHAKVLLSLPSCNLQSSAAKYVVEKKLSVRETEQYVKALLQPKPKEKQNSQIQTHIAALENDISHLLSAKVKIRHGKKDNGKIEIHYFDVDDFERIVSALKK